MALTAKSKFLLEKGEVVRYDWYNYPNGSCYIVKYKNHYFSIDDDGTGNGFYCKGKPYLISEKRAKEILCNFPSAWEKAKKLWNWEDLETYFERNFEKEFLNK